LLQQLVERESEAGWNEQDQITIPSRVLAVVGVGPTRILRLCMIAVNGEERRVLMQASSRSLIRK